MRFFRALLVLLGIVCHVTLLCQLDIEFSEERGFYDQATSVTLSSSDPSANIRYTLDGTPPSTTSGTVYSSPISVTTTATIRAIAYSASEATLVQTHTYLYVADVINQPNAVSGFPTTDFAFDLSIKNHATYGPQLVQALKDIPSISLVMDLTDFNTMHNGSVEKPTSVELIYPNGQESYQVNAGIERAGGSSFNSRKRNMRLSFKEIYGDSKLRYPIFGEDAAREFDQISLRPGFHGCMHIGKGNNRGGSNDLADQVMRDLQIELDKDKIGLHGNFMHLYINGVYWGVYNPSERGTNSFGESYYGGEKDDWDAIKRKAALDGTITAWDTLNSMVDNQDMSIPANYLAVQQYVDIVQFTNYVIMTNFGPHSDDHFSGKNSFVTRDRTQNEGFRFWIWDTEPALGHYWTWRATHIGTYPYDNIFNSLLANSDYRLMVGDQVECHCKNDGPLSPSKSVETYEKRYAETQTAMLAEAARWVGEPEYADFITTRDRIVNTYLPGRASTLISNYRANNLYPNIDAVDYSSYGGVVGANHQVTLTNPNNSGSIYYTLDGTDPRSSGGALSSAAILYNTSISLPDGVVELHARVLDAGVWSTMCPQTFHVNQNYGDLVINEIHYHPSDSILPNGDTISGRNFEFIEVKNKGIDTVHLQGKLMATGVSLVLDQTLKIPPSGYAVFAEDLNWFLSKYGFQADGKYKRKLNNGGEQLVLLDPESMGIDSVIYNDKNPWDEAPDGSPYSLELLDCSVSNTEPLNWFRSKNMDGTPKAPNSRQCATSPSPILINEINYNSNNLFFDPGDWVEFYNPSSQIIDLSGYRFYDNGNEFIFPPNTSIGAMSFLILAENSSDFTTLFSTIPTQMILGDFAFGLSDKGERITLFDENDCLADYVIYNNKAPWPLDPAQGTGATLSLIDPSLDNALAASWESSQNISAPFGTPGSYNADEAVVDLKIWLEAPFNAFTQTMNTTLRAKGLLPGQTPVSANYVPTPAGQPYNVTPWNYSGTEGNSWTDSDYAVDDVDWVLVSFRTGPQASNEFEKKAAMLKSNGTIVFPNAPNIPVAIGQVYIVIEHRNHLACMSPYAIPIVGGILQFDFQVGDSYKPGASFGQTQLPNGSWALYGANVNQIDGIFSDIDGDDKRLWSLMNGVFGVYTNEDVNLNGDINSGDKAFFTKNNGIHSGVQR